MTTASSNEFAVVTGASSGIGFELAKQFAEHGYDLLVCAEDTAIDQAAADLRRDGQNQVVPVRADLATYNGVESSTPRSWKPAVRSTPIAINAGRGIGGDFVRRPSSTTS